MSQRLVETVLVALVTRTKERIALLRLMPLLCTIVLIASISSFMYDQKSHKYYHFRIKDTRSPATYFSRESSNPVQTSHSAPSFLPASAAVSLSQCR